MEHEATAEQQRRKLWGAELKRRREAASLTQPDLAEKAGVTFMSISRIERGVSSGSDKTRIAIAKALGVQVTDIFAYPAITEAAS